MIVCFRVIFFSAGTGQDEGAAYDYIQDVPQAINTRTRPPPIQMKQNIVYGVPGPAVTAGGSDVEIEMKRNSIYVHTSVQSCGVWRIKPWPAASMNIPVIAHSCLFVTLTKEHNTVTESGV